MIIIGYGELKAFFNSDETKWESVDTPDFESSLNYFFPDHIYDVDSIYYQGEDTFKGKPITGREALALEAISFLKPELVVLEYEETPPPDLKKGEYV